EYTNNNHNHHHHHHHEQTITPQRASSINSRSPNNTAKSPEMSTFIGEGAPQQRPKAASNYTDPTWSSSRYVGGGDHVRKVLIVSSLVCGVACVDLLFVVGSVF
nr:hypothetical protein LSAT_2X93200 [Tanacetum cinerariifolium]